MTPHDEQELKRLLEKMVAENKAAGKPPDFIPDACLAAFYKATRTPFLELIICRESREPNGTYQYLYQDRHDENWNGLTAYGGMVRAGFPESPVEIAQKLLDREFKGLDLKVLTLRVVSVFGWSPANHPWCNPVPTVCLVEVDKDIEEGNGRRWISIDTPPNEYIVYHADYVRQCESFLTHGPLEFTPGNPLGLHQETRGLWLREAG